MHGMLFFDMNNNQVIVKGFLNWWMSVELILCLGVGLLFFDTIFTLGLMIFISLLLDFHFAFNTIVIQT